MVTNKGYATVEQLAEIIGIKVNIPSWEPGTTPSNEEVGTGDNSATIFYLDQKNILDGTYTLFYGADATTTTELIDVTDYSIESDTGKITLTTAGKTKVGTNKIFAKYSYTKNAMSNSYLTEILNRSETKVDNETNTTFTDGTATNPTYPLETEIQSSPGYFREQIIIEEKPLIDIVTTLDGDLAIDATTVPVATGTGSNYPSSGYIIINSEVISYTGISTDNLTGCTRGTMGTTATTHTDGDSIHSTILFLSNTQEGVARVYTIQPWDINMHANETGLFYSYNQSVFQASQYSDRLYKQDVADRVKLIYYHGYDTIPEDITRLTLIFAKEMLVKDAIGSSLIAGKDEFRPGVMTSNMGEIESIINSYIVIPMGNT
jgi:hypothetical protein